MALFDNDEARTELQTELNKLLGVPEGKTFADVLKDAVNGPVNAVDKRAKEALTKAIDELKPGLLDAETVEGIKAVIAKGADPPGGGGTDPKDVDLKSLPPAVRDLIQKSQDAVETLNKKLEKETAAREAAESERIETEHAGMRRYMEAQTREAAIAAGFDPSKMEFFMPWVKNGERVRGIEGKDGKFEFQTGEVDQFGDPVWKPLKEGLEHFSKTEVGKQFRAAKAPPGAPTPPPGSPPPGGGDRVSIDTLGGDPAKIREAADKGLIDYGQG